MPVITISTVSYFLSEYAMFDRWNVESFSKDLLRTRTLARTLDLFLNRTLVTTLQGITPIKFSTAFSTVIKNIQNFLDFFSK